MSILLEACAGRVHVIKQGKGQAGGIYKMRPEITAAEGSKCLLLGVPFAFQEIVQPSVTLDDKRTLYVFGSSWTEVQVSGLLLLGDHSSSAKAVEQLRKWYDENRVSVKKEKPVWLSIGSSGMEVYVVGMTVGQVDTTFHKQPFTIHTLMPKS